MQFAWASTPIVTEFCALFPGLNLHDETVTLTTANGDQLFGTGVGTGALVDFTDPGQIRILVDVTIAITGGTGQLANSTGIIRETGLSKVYERTFLPDGTPLGPLVVTLEGTLSSGADKR